MGFCCPNFWFHFIVQIIEGIHVVCMDNSSDVCFCSGGSQVRCACSVLI